MGCTGTGGGLSWGDIEGAFGDLWDTIDDPLECTAATVGTIGVCGLEIAACLASAPVQTRGCQTDVTGQEICTEPAEGPSWLFCLISAGLVLGGEDPCVAAAGWFVDACLPEDEDN